jgi:hypothetical protein
MKVLKVVVDELPTDCGECDLRTDEYCTIKGVNTGSQWVNRFSSVRDVKCPLKLPCNCNGRCGGT